MVRLLIHSFWGWFDSSSREGRVFILAHWIRSQWSVHRFSFPTVVSLRSLSVLPNGSLLQPCRFTSHPYFHDGTNFFFFDPVDVVALAHVCVLSSFSFMPHFNTILQMLKTWNLSSTLTTPTTLRTISTALAEQLVAKRQAQLIPSSLQTTWGKPVTSSLCSARPTRQSTPSSSKWRKTEEVNLIGEIQKLCCELQPLFFLLRFFVLRSGWVYHNLLVFQTSLLLNLTKKHYKTCLFSKVCFPFQVVQGEAEVVTIEMTAGIDILEGVILVVLGTGIMVEDLTTAQIKLLAQIHRMVAMGAVMAAAMASVEAVTMVMDSPTLTTKQEASQARTTSRPSSLLPVRMAHRLPQVIPPSLLPRHRLLSSTPHHWCPIPCLLSSLSKRTLHLKEVIYCFLSCFKFYI